ncbi:MAG: hypothetical protein LKK19_03350 [Bacteroidales bacterium]|jgi:hypothetical protein|nr:hypothetical protein [Bacteroidales bacterium]MCI2121722.1 hypothetical protein [Bacteroidales bacterium]MCI2145366.1 hypothetical protein [Bacteroidales bacterium]
MKRNLNLTIAIAVCMILTSCGTGRILTTERKPDEAIIIAKVRIENGDSYIGNKWNLLLDERLWGKMAVWPDENNYIYMKVPVGKHFIALLQYKALHKNIPENYLTFETDTSAVYYIGDIVIHWKINSETDENRSGRNAKVGGAVGGVFGAVSNSKEPGTRLDVDVTDNYDETTAYFKSRFGYDQEIRKSLLKVNK